MMFVLVYYDPVDLSILNLNCWLFPEPIATDCQKRIDSIIEMVQSQRPDIVTLQEVWSNRFIKQFESRLTEYYSIHAGTSLYNQSGLLTLLRSKSLHHEINFYEQTQKFNITEHLLHKGYVQTNIIIEGQEWIVVNTHLYAPLSEETIEIPEKQFLSLITEVRGTNLLICGDMNIDEMTLDTLCKSDFQRLCNAENTVDSCNPYTKVRLNRYISKPEGEKIDYILYRGPKVVHKEFKLFKAPYVSDHYAMLARISVE